MKRVFILLSLWILMSQFCEAQTIKGNFTLGGNASFITYKQGANNDYRSNTFGLSPKLGYFITDNFEIGSQLSIGSSKSQDVSQESKGFAWGIGPYARYYHFTENNRFAFYGQLSASLGFGKMNYKYEDESLNSETKYGNFGISLSPGFTYFFTDKWGMDLHLSGISLSWQDPNTDVDNDTQSTLGLAFNLHPSLGLRYYINK